MILVIFLISIFTFLFLGIPVAFSILLTVFTMAESSGVTSFDIVPSYLYSGVNNFALMAIPFFILCGDLMNAGNLSKGIVDFCRVLLGHIKAGIGYAAILACMIFAALTGAAVVTVSAIGGIMLPLMIKEGYDPADSTACVCAGAITGPIIPPSLPMVIFGVLSGVSVTKMFIGGVIPGIITGLICMVAWYFMNKKRSYAMQPKATPAQVWKATKTAFPALMMPVIMMGGILGGIFTPTEAGVVACVYAWFVSTFVYRKMNFKLLKKVVIGSAKSSAVIMLIVATCQALAMVITVARIPQAIAELISTMSSNPIVVMCLINVFVLIVGLFMDVTPALTILTPIFLPIATSIGMDPVVFGVTMIYGLVIGLITPPVGNVLYIGIGISKITLLDLLKRIWPMVILYFGILFLITLVPQLILFLPNLVMG
ncbi:TRAP transporter large permease [Oscillibacter sp.]|uniref:TRAP transporter large permease n=1 Tax=Oscillibacter sp. TaxID=1945593 RepID=UPI0026397E52|nr:TRAP transporter large permease [Oscillibacter sp.]MDD3347647.1 TRAP transporter large permease [Oscillibacter sp.]